MFLTILDQTIFLFIFIALGFLFGKLKFLPENAALTLSKLETYLFVPALVMSAFIENCNLETITECRSLLLCAIAEMFLFIILGLIFSKILYKRGNVRNVTTYGLAFANFGFMGMAIIKGAFPEIFFEYTVFTLPLWAGIYLWGAPVLLIADADGEKKKRSFKDIVKPFINPILIAMMVGLIVGLTGLRLPSPIVIAINSAGNCMSPVAMFLTGLTVAGIDLLKMIKNYKLYIISAVKLILFPAVFIAVALLLKGVSFINNTALICCMNFAVMPIGMNGIVIPAAYGKDVTDATGMVLITHILSIATIPIAYMIFQNLLIV